MATGFLVEIDSITHLVTAKHVVVHTINGKLTDSLDDAKLYAFFNNKKAGITRRSITQYKSADKINWIFHSSMQTDIAVIPFPIDTLTDDLVVIPHELFLSPDRVFELYDVFFLSFQPGLESFDQITPIARSGTVSLIRTDKSFYIDGFAFPGNSGSPVFLKPALIRFDEGNINLGNDALGNKFIGLIGEYLPYQEVAISTQTLRPRVIFEENTGLSKVWSFTFIKEIAESKAFKSQVARLKGH